MDCESTIIHSLDLTWAIVGTFAGGYSLLRLLGYLHLQSGRDLFALILTFVAYPWAVAVMHLTPLDKGMVYAICAFSVALYGVAVLRLLAVGEPHLSRYRHTLFLAATLLAALAVSNPWLGYFASFDIPVAGQPNHLLDYHTAGIGAHLTLIFAGLVVIGTASPAALRILRSRFVLSYTLLGVLLPVIALLTFFDASSWSFLTQRQVNPYFLITTFALFYFSYLSFRRKLIVTMPPAHTQIVGLMPDAIVVVDDVGTAVECNPAFESLVGQQSSQIIEQPLSKFLPNTGFLDNRDLTQCVLSMESGQGLKHFDVQVTSLVSASAESNTRMILMRDTTAQTSAFQQLQDSEQQLYKANGELERLSTTDALTGLRNRRYLQQQLEQELERINRDGTNFGLLSVDLDHFKDINDCHGHQMGDRVLTQVSRILEGQCRAIDTLARIGGEEFMVLLVNCDQDQLARAAERFRSAVEAHVMSSAAGIDLSVTASIGATLVEPGDSMRDALHRVDDLLYCAKRQGRNRTVAV